MILVVYFFLNALLVVIFVKIGALEYDEVIIEIFVIFPFVGIILRLELADAH